MGRGLRHRAVPAALLLVLTLCAFPGRRSLEGGVGRGEDLAEHDLPQAALYARALARGEIPLWNPHKGLGVPCPEAPFMGPFYPGFLLHLLLPPGAALNAGFLLHIFLSGLFMLMLCRRLGAGPLEAWVGAATWVLGSVFRLYSHEGWLPETVAACYLPGACLLLLGPGRAAGAGAAARWMAGAGLVLGLQVLGGHPSYALVAWLLALLFGLASAAGRGHLARVAGSFLIGAALSSPAWGPLLVEGALNQGGRLAELGHLPAHAFSPGDLLNYLRYSTGEERLHFAGRPMLLLGLAGAALCLRRRRWEVPAVLAAAVALAVNAGGAATGLPLLNLVSAPSTWHMGVVLALAAGGALALHRLARAARGRWGPAGALALVLGLGALQVADLAVYHLRMPTRRRQPVQTFFRQEPFASFLARDRSLYRVITSPEVSPLWRMNQGTLAGVDVYNSRVKGVSVRRLTGQVSLSSEVEHRLDPRLLPLINVKYWLITRPGLRWDEALQPPGFELALKQEVSTGEAKVLAVVLRHRAPFPRAFLVERDAAVDPHPLLMGVTPEPLQRLKLPARVWSLLRAHRPVQVARRPNGYRVSYTASHPGLLILSEMFHPAWRATLDGEALELAPVMGAFTSAQVPAGRHRVELHFQPTYLYLFGALSLLALVVVVVTFLGAGWGSKT